MIDLFDEVDVIRVVADLPGVSEEGIKVELKGDALVITARGEERRYSRELILPAKVEPSSVTTSYRNGILEVVLAKRGDG